MSATLVAKDLAAAHGDRTLFADLDLVVAPGDVIGLVGANGAGKSTLLRILAGLRGTGGRHACRSARPPRPSATCRRSPSAGRARRCARSWPAHRRRGGAGRDGRGRRRRSPPGGPGADDAYADALERWLALGGADLDERADAVAADLGLAVDLDQPMTSLSGGQAARAGLASLLLSRYDIFLLDEPTNDLDLDGLDRLEAFVAGLRRRHRRGQPRPRVPRPHGHPRRRARPRPAAGQRLRRRLRGVPGGARGRPPARARGVRGVRRHRSPTSRRAPGCSAPGWRRASATPAARPRTTTRSAGSSAPRRPRSRPPRRGRPSG